MKILIAIILFIIPKLSFSQVTKDTVNHMIDSAWKTHLDYLNKNFVDTIYINHALDTAEFKGIKWQVKVDTTQIDSLVVLSLDTGGRYHPTRKDLEFKLINPAIGFIQLEIPSDAPRKAGITLINSGGVLFLRKEIQLQSGNNIVKINATTLSPGLYIIGIENELGYFEYKKVTVLKQ